MYSPNLINIFAVLSGVDEGTIFGDGVFVGASDNPVSTVDVGVRVATLRVIKVRVGVLVTVGNICTAPVHPTSIRLSRKKA